MEFENDNYEFELPFGPPPVLPDIKTELREYIVHPDRLPIHNVNEVQQYFPRESNIYSLLQSDLSTSGTILKYERNPITGCIEHCVEVSALGVGETVRNSMSMTRAPGPVAEGVRGNVSNFLFWPGGFEEPEKMQCNEGSDVDLENNLRIVATGFKAGVKFQEDNRTPKTTQTVENTKHSLMAFDGTFDLMSVVNEEGNTLGQWDNVQIENKNVNKTKETKVEVPEMDEIIEPVETKKIPVLNISEKSRMNKTEWAEELDVSLPVTDFDSRVPDPALTFPYELDTFQKQAIIKLEENCNVFVAAHTSAGKTTVAEYAIALTQRHMTRAIYTSPIKALSNQKFRDFKDKFPSVGLLTGDMQINQTASCLIMTTEILQSMLYCASDVIRDLEYVIFDEVHYINNEDRGHVWEEIVILLPPNVNIVMLSATVPNPLKFANWVGQIKRRKMYVISTLSRPVPLEHYLYTGSDKKTKYDVFRIYANSVFNRDKLMEANKAIELRKAAHAAKAREQYAKMQKNNYVRKQKVTKIISGQELLDSEKTILALEDNDTTDNEVKHGSVTHKERIMWTAFIEYVSEKKQLPVVVFSLSRKRCDNTVEAFSTSLLTQSERDHVQTFFKQSIKRLKGSDARLPQVLKMQKLLQLGIGVHHSGILPILKEIVEMLFQKGIVKILFATETFAMGVNMPARTVAFDAIRKYDGSSFRNLHPTEYIQMAGRAGRRGHDTIGTVIIICKHEVPSEKDLRVMLCGAPQSLESKFKVTYSMVLHLMRLSEAVAVKDMMRRSFREANTLMHEKKNKAELENVSKLLEETPILSESQERLGLYYDLAVEYLRWWKKLRPHMLVTKKAAKCATEGRVVLLSYKHHYNKLGILLKRQPSTSTAPSSIKVLVLSNTKSKESEIMPESWYEIIALTKKELFVPETPISHEVLVVPDSSILELTNCIIKTEASKVLWDWENRQIPRFKDAQPGPTCTAAIEELYKLTLEAQANNNVLLPYVDMKLHEFNLQLEEESMNAAKRMLDLVDINWTTFEEEFDAVFRRRNLEEKQTTIMSKLSDESLRDYPEYLSKVAVLKELGYIDHEDRVTLKGRVALEMGSHELLLTELVFKNILTDWRPSEIAAMLSALVFQYGRRADEYEEIDTSRLGQLQKLMETEFNELKNVEFQHGINSLTPISFSLTRVVYEWARAESFASIMKLTDVQEGIIVRCIQQLHETLRDVKNASVIIGNPVLKEKMEEAITKIKRDIVFTASLYTQD